MDLLATKQSIAALSLDFTDFVPNGPPSDDVEARKLEVLMRGLPYMARVATVE